MQRLRKNPFAIHTIAFFLMVISPMFLYFAARGGTNGWIWVLLGIFVAGNILVLLTK